MSSSSRPITAAAFAAALPALPVSSLHAKAAELRNSIAHLRASNEQLAAYAAGGDADCAEAVAENEEVVGRMRERVALLRREVEGRGMRWVEGDGDEKDGSRVGDVDMDEDGGEDGNEGRNGVNGADNSEHETDRRDVGDEGDRLGQEDAPRRSEERRRLTDEELARRLRERMDEGEDGDEGLHL